MIIEYLKLGTFENAKSRGWNGAGYYFWDEADGQYCYGPYSTYDEALVAFDKYAEHLANKENLMNDKTTHIAGKITHEDIDKAMDHPIYDFSNIAKIVKALEIKWGDIQTPDENQIRDIAKNFVKKVIDTDPSKEIVRDHYLMARKVGNIIELNVVMGTWLMVNPVPKNQE